jgi:hypothetical protein
MNADGVRARGKKTLVGPTLVVGIGQSDPQKDFAVFDYALEVPSMAGQEPRRQSVPKASCARTEPISKALGERTGRAAEKFAVVGECQLLNDHKLLRPHDDELSSEDAPDGETVEAVENQATKAQVVERVAQLLPGVESTDRKAEVGPVSQNLVHLKMGTTSQETHQSLTLGAAPV